MSLREIPIFLTGLIHPNDAPPACRDGVDFLIHTEGWPLRVRLQPACEASARGLEEAAQTRELVVVSGFRRRDPRPGCDYVEVYGVDLVDLFVERQKAA